jgi:hypothetical protein
MTDQFYSSDQDEWDQMPEEKKEHFTKAMVHQAGLGPHPGKYQGPEQGPASDGVSESALARAHMQEMGPPEQTPPQGPLPPQEAVAQPMPQGGKKQGSKPPTQGTPTAIGAAAVKPPEPEGGF